MLTPRDPKSLSSSSSEHSNPSGPLALAPVIREVIQQIVKETSGAPSMVLYDGKNYKVIPTELADALEAALRGLGGAPVERSHSLCWTFTEHDVHGGKGVYVLTAEQAKDIKLYLGVGPCRLASTSCQAESRVLGGAPEAKAEPTMEQKHRYALRQCFLLAIREARKARKADASRSSEWNHVLRFCQDADVNGDICGGRSVLRQS